MAANIEKQQKFIELRAEGLSFDEIAKKVNISKPTLIKWSKELKDKIEEVTQIIEEQFLAEQRIKNIARAQKISPWSSSAGSRLQTTRFRRWPAAPASARSAANEGFSSRQQHRSATKPTARPETAVW